MSKKLTFLGQFHKKKAYKMTNFINQCFDELKG